MWKKFNTAVYNKSRHILPLFFNFGLLHQSFIVVIFGNKSNDSIQ